MKNSRGVLSALSSGLLLRIAGAAVNLLAVPIALHILGPARYGNFAALLGLAGWLIIGNLGLGNATAMSLAGLHGRDVEARSVFWQTVCAACVVVALMFAVAFYPFTLFVGGLVKSAPVEQQQEFQWASYYSFLVFAICAIGAPFEGLYSGRLRTDYCNLTRLTWQMVAICVLLMIATNFGNMLSLCFAVTLAPLGSALWFIGKGIAEYPPPATFRFRVREGLPLVRQGLGFLASSIAILFHGGGYLPLFVMAFGKEQLATAGVLSRVTQMYCSLIAVLLIPLGVGLRHALSSDDGHWIRRSLQLATMTLLGAAFGVGITLVVFGDTIIAWWSGAHLPALDEWLLPEALLLGVISWSYLWVYASLAMHGSSVVATLAIAEIAIISAVYYSAGDWFPPSHSLYISAATMLLLSGTILPLRVLTNSAFDRRVSTK